jgi:8-oxo-dGTP diphosphatase
MTKTGQASSRSTRERPSLITLAVLLHVRDGALHVLLWRRAREPDLGHWALPGGALEAGTSLEESIRDHLVAKVDVHDVAHLEQLETLSDPDRHPERREIAAAYLGLVPADHDPELPPDTRWHPVAELPPMAFDHGVIVRAGVERLRAKLSYTNIGFAIAPNEFTLSELRDIYVAGLGRRVTATNLERVLLRRGVLEPLDRRRRSTAAGGRPPRVFRFRTRRLEVTDPFAVLRPI